MTTRALAPPILWKSYARAPAEANLATNMTPHASGGAYVNFLTGDEGGRVEDAYGGNLGRLRELKRRSDPSNLLRMNQNIRP